jgi:FtsP/CotA-like multicopper oxidase with cupredoxin domain
MTAGQISRRQLLHGGAGIALAAGAGCLLNGRAFAQAPATILNVDTRVLEVKGQAAKVYSLTQPDGFAGLETSLDRRFRVDLVNHLAEDTLVHWHGLTPPSDQDGVPELSQAPLNSGGRYSYDFALDRPGTYWMHSHVGLQEQMLLAAPLIVHDPADAGRDEQEPVILLHDFSFKDPEEILQSLQAVSGGGHAHQPGTPPAHGHSAMTGGAMAKAGDAMAKMGDAGSMTMDMDLNDVEFDAYLANDRTLDDPEIIRVEPGGKLRLRIINAAASTNFQIDLGALSGTLIAVDGQAVQPVTGKRFEIAIAQRLDVRVKLPAGQGSYPILAQREGDRLRSGVVLATKSAVIAKLPEKSESEAPPVRLELEKRLKAAVPLPARPVDRQLNLDLTGSMALYQWSLNGRVYRNREPLMVAEGERVEILMHNQTGMAHPMHLHGHVFQVVAIEGKRLEGALRDTVMVPPKGSVTIAFDANNPGRWAYHCHNLYHMAAGMFTSLEYLS